MLIAGVREDKGSRGRSKIFILEVWGERDGICGEVVSRGWECILC